MIKDLPINYTHYDNIKFDEMSYPINAKYIEEFANFAEHSGGFRIN